MLRDLVEDPKRSKILHHAKFDALWLRIHFGWRMRGIRCTMLLSQLYWAGLQVRHGLGFLSERAIAAGAPGVWLVSKELQKSEWRWRLSNAQINYAATDALVMLPLFKWLGGLIAAAGMLPTALAECNAVAAFVEFEYNGLPVNPAMLADHIELWRRGRFRRWLRSMASRRDVVTVRWPTRRRPGDCFGGCADRVDTATEMVYT